MGFFIELEELDGELCGDGVALWRLFAFWWPLDHVFVDLGGVDGFNVFSFFDLFGLAEERGEFVELFLFPIVEGVIVAFCALESDAEEDLGGGASERHGVGIVAEGEADGGGVVGATVGGDEFAHESVVGFVFCDAFVHEGEEFGSAGEPLIGSDAEHVGEENGPSIGEGFAGDEAIDEFAAAVWGAVLFELADFFGGGDAGDEVDGSAAEER